MINIETQELGLIGISILLVAIPVVLGVIIGYLERKHIDDEVEVVDVSHCCHECCGCQGCAGHEHKDEEECGCCGKALSECKCNCSCHNHEE